MKKRILFSLSLAAAALAVVAASAGVGTAAVERSSAISCKSTMKIAFATPLTGDAGFLGNEQAT